jgi:hypothetical protein
MEANPPVAADGGVVKPLSDSDLDELEKMGPPSSKIVRAIIELRALRKVMAGRDALMIEHINNHVFVVNVLTTNSDCWLCGLEEDNPVHEVGP